MLGLGGGKEYFWLGVREDFLQEAAFELDHEVQTGFQQAKISAEGRNSQQRDRDVKRLDMPMES